MIQFHFFPGKIPPRSGLPLRTRPGDTPGAHYTTSSRTTRCRCIAPSAAPRPGCWTQAWWRMPSQADVTSSPGDTQLRTSKEDAQETQSLGSRHDAGGVHKIPQPGRCLVVESVFAGLQQGKAKQKGTQKL